MLEGRTSTIAVIPACSCRTGVAEPYLPPDVVDEGTRIFEELLRTWASQISERDGDDVVMGDFDDPATTESEKLKRCAE